MSSLMEALGRARVSVHPDFLVLVEREIYAHDHSSYVGLEDWNEACHRAHAEIFSLVKPHVPQLMDWVNVRFPATTLYADSYSPFCLVADSLGDADAIQAYVEEFCGTIPKLAFVRNDVYARLCHADFNKGTALGEITRRLGLEPSDVFAVGDWLNDLPMLDRRFAHLLAAPANAIDSVKQALRAVGGHISSLPHGHGVADSLRFHLRP